MVGRFTARRAATPDAPVPEEPPSSELEGVSWTVFPDSGSEQGAAAQQSESPLLSDKLLDAKVRLASASDRGDQPLRAGQGP